MSNFDGEISLRKLEYSELHINQDVWWVTSDSGAFGSQSNGPLGDWINNHPIINQALKGRGTVVQAGGNCGMYALFYSKMFRQVHSFEPHPRNFECLKRNTENISNIQIDNVALGDVKGTCEIYGGSNSNVGMYKVKTGDNKSVKMITIDSLNLIQCDLIHLDLEGFEPQAINGAANTIKRFRPIIITEAGHGGDEITQLGYKRQDDNGMVADKIFLPI